MGLRMPGNERGSGQLPWQLSQKGPIPDPLESPPYLFVIDAAAAAAVIHWLGTDISVVRCDGTKSLVANVVAFIFPQSIW